MAIRTFRRTPFGTGSTYICKVCMRRTRNTGDEGGTITCRHCFELCGIDNSISDGAMTFEEAKPEIDRLSAELVAKGGALMDDWMSWHYVDGMAVANEGVL